MYEGPRHAIANCSNAASAGAGYGVGSGAALQQRHNGASQIDQAPTRAGIHGALDRLQRVQEDHSALIQQLHQRLDTAGVLRSEPTAQDTKATGGPVAGSDLSQRVANCVALTESQSFVLSTILQRLDL